MAANKVVFGNKVLIDLTGDTVTEEALLKGYTAHKADGTIITGTAFAGYPNEFVFLDNIQDSSGNPIKDSSGKTIQGQTIYRKARNSVLLDSTGDVIEDGFEQQIDVVKFVWVSFISRLFLHLNPLGTVNAGQFVSNIYNYFVLVFNYDRGHFGCNIVCGDDAIALPNDIEWDNDCDFAAFWKNVDEQIRLRIPDKYLQAYGWL